MKTLKEMGNGSFDRGARPFATIHYAWRVLGQVEGEDEPRLFVPHGDPMQHEFPIDFIFDSSGKAHVALDDYELREEAVADNWVLVQMIIQPISQLESEVKDA